MALDDRDRIFQKALARHLRHSASSSLGAHSAGEPAEGSVELCPDPEMLAAYHDGALSSDERNLWKQHVLSCDRCQLVLSHLETPLDIPVPSGTSENVVVLQQPDSAARTPSPRRIARPSPVHTLRWLWLVPAGAIAATLVAYVSLKQPKPLPVLPSSPVEVAENRQPAAAPVEKSAAPALSQNKEREEADQRTDRSAAGVPSDDRDSTLHQLRSQVQLSQQAPSQYAAKAAHGPSFPSQKQEQQIGRIAAGRAGTLDQKKFDTEVSPAVGERERQALALPALPPPPPRVPQSSEPGFLADGSVSAPLNDKSPSAPAPAPASNPPASKSKVNDASPIPAATETVEVTGAGQSYANARAPERRMLRAAALENPHVFWAPGGKQAWRIGPAGSLEHSKDKGLNWTPQISGVYTDLLAGFAPTAKACWIVGASGTILRTNDGGTHWTKLDSPVTNDLTGVRATDATHAWIWFVPDRETGLIATYQTSDGGATWSLLSNP